MAVVFSNNAATALASSVTNSATSLTVQDGSVFPTLSGADYTYITLEDLDGNVEIVKLTARSGNTLTVARAQDGTSARAFSSGSKCELRLTAALLNEVATQADTDTNTTYTAGSGLSLTGTEFANTAPDQTVALTGAGATSISGTYPSFTITSTDTVYTLPFADNSTNWNTAYDWGNHASQSYATQSYVGTAISNLVDSSPATLDTLNELAAALGDDPNFATTVSNSIGTKWTQDNTKISNWDTAYGWGNHASAGYVVGNTSNAINLTITGVMQANNGYKVGTSTVIDSSRNLTNIGTISSNGTVTINTVAGTLVIEDFGAGSNKIRSNGSLKLAATGSVALQHGATERLETASSGVIVTGDVNASGLLKVGTNDTEYANNYIRFKSAGAAYIDHFTVGQDINFRLSDGSSLDKTVLTIDNNGQLHATSTTNVRLTLGSEGTTGNNSSNWIRGNTNRLQFNTAGGDYNWEVIGSTKMTLTSAGVLNPVGGYQVNGTTVIDSSRNLTNVTVPISNAEYGQSLNGNFGQWLDHARYAATPGFNQDVDYWGWNFVQGNINAPHTSSSQWYRNRVSLGNSYGHGIDTGDYWLEIAHPRTTSASGSMYIRNCESGTIGSWVEVGSNIRTGFKINGTTVIDSSRNLTNIGTISSGAITSTVTNTGDATLLTLHHDTGADLARQKSFIDFSFADTNTNETPQVRIGAEVGQNNNADTQEKEGSGAFVVYTNNADTISGAAGASLAERFRVDYVGDTWIKTGRLIMGGTTVIDSSRNLTNIAGFNPISLATNNFTQPNDGGSAIAGGWISASFGKNNNKVVIGSHSSKAVVGAHNDALNAWDALHLQGTSVNFLSTAGSQVANVDTAGFNTTLNYRIGNTTVISSSRAITGSSLSDGYITWSFAQMNRYGAAIELQYTPTNAATLVKIGANGSNPTIFNAFTGDASFSGAISITGGKLASYAADANAPYFADGGNVGIRLSQAGTDDIQPCSTAGANRPDAINLGAGDNRFKDIHLSGTYHVGSAGVGKIQGTVDSSYFPIIGSPSSGAASIYLNGATRSGFAGHLQLAGSNTVFFNETLSQERMRITSAGVGIGTSLPSGVGTTLNVRGESAGDVGSIISESNDGAGFINLYSGIGGTDLPSIVYPSAGLRFGSGSKNTATYSEKMRITSAGDVNINTGALQLGGTTVIDSSRNLTNVTIKQFTPSAYSPYISPTNPNTLNAGWDLNTDASDMWINYRGYQDGWTRFRDFRIGDGKGTALLFVDGSARAFDFQSGSSIQMGSQTVIDSSRNITAGTISATGGNSNNWNTAYTVANAAAPKAGATFTGQVNVNYSAAKFVVGGTSTLDTSDAERPNITLTGGMYPHMTIDARDGNAATNTNHGPVFSFVQRLSISGHRRFSIGTAAYNGDRMSFGYADNNANPHYGMGTDSTGAMMYLTTGSQLIVNGSVNTPIVYDKDNTGYYVNPASTSNINALAVAGGLTLNSTNLYFAGVGDNNHAINYPGGTHVGETNGTQFRFFSYLNLYSSRGGTSVMTLKYDKSVEFNGQIKVGAFAQSQNNTGEAWIGRAADRSLGVLTVQLGGTSPAKMEIVDSGWTTVEHSFDEEGISTSFGSKRAPIFYDSASTGYYVDPASISSLYGLAIRGDLGSTATQNQLTLWGAGNTATSAIGFKANGGVFTNPTGNGDGYNTYLSMDAVGRGWVFRRAANGNDFTSAYNAGWILNNGIAQFNASVRSPIFYDSDNTGYYVDPATSSVLNTVGAGTITSWSHVAATGGFKVAATTVIDSSRNLTNIGTISSGNITAGTITPTASNVYSLGSTSNYYTQGYITNVNTTNINAVGTIALSSGQKLTLQDGNHFLRYQSTGFSGVAIDGPQLQGHQGGELATNYSQGNQYALRWDYLGNTHSRTSSRAPLFYDSNNTAYYVDPALTSNLNKASIYGGVQVGQSSVGYSITDTFTYDGVAHQHYGVTFKPSKVVMSGYAGLGLFTQSTERLSISNTGNVTIQTDIRSPIFYDSNNTGYYVDPASGSNLNGTLVNNGGTGMTGGWNRNLLLNSTFPVIVFNSNSAKYSGIGVDYTVSDGGMKFWVGGNSSDITNGSASLVLKLDTGNFVTAAGSVRAPLVYDSNNTGYYIDAGSSGTSVRIAGDILCDGNYGKGMVGVYTSTRLQHVWSMGAAYRLAADGTTAGNMYGLAWSHPNAGSLGGANNLNDHGLLLINNGSFRAAISSRAVFSADVRGTLFYDYNNTGYYVDPNSTSNLNILTTAGDITAGGRVYIQGSTTNFLAEGPYASTNLGINFANALFLFSGTTQLVSFSTVTSYFKNQIVADTDAATTGTASATIISRGTVTTTTGYQPQNYHITFQNAAQVVKGSISSSHYATIYSTSSDYRLKEDVQPIDNATERVLALNPVNFKWIDGQQRSDGFLAHELQEHLPEAVTGEKDATTEVTETVVADDGTETEVTTTVPEMQGIDQSKLVPLLVKTIQELEARITALENA